MKRGMTGGTYRGPAALARQRRAIRVVQAMLVLIAAGLLVYAGYSMGRASGIEAGRSKQGLAPARSPSTAQTVVLGALGVAAFAGALLLQGSGVRVPTPARLDELTGRAHAAFESRADEVLSPEGERTAQEGPERRSASSR